MKVVVVIPTYNESGNVGRLVERLERSAVSRLGEELHILFVDDGSPDGTASEVESLARVRPTIHLLRRAGKMGIGSAYIDGFRWAVKAIDPGIFVQMDADLQHPPEMVAALLSALDQADVALASRYVPGGGSEAWSWRRKAISKGANSMARILLRLGVKDVTTGFKALNRRSVDVLLAAKLSASGFTYQVESVYLLDRAGISICEVPYVFKRRISGESKLSASEVIEFLLRVVSLRFSGR